MATDPTPAQSDETLQDAVNKILDEYAGKYKPREYSDKIIGRIFDAVEGAIDAKIDNQGQIQILTGDALEGYLYGIQVLRAELRAAIKRLREGK